MKQKNTVHAFCDDVLADHDGVALASLLKTKKICQREVIEAALTRAEQVEPFINAIEFAYFEEALADAERQRHGFFAGVPTFIKDNRDVKGCPTRHGSAAVSALPARRNDPYINQFLKLGFSVLGKSTLPEFGFNATTEPVYRAPTRNPWNTDYSCGASSGGSSALVAAGVVPIAHGNDGGGSIRIPAACCGLIGLKPSRGRHVRPSQALGLPVDILSEGVLSRSVRDTARFHFEAEKYYYNKKLPPIGEVTGANSKRLRIGFVIDSVTGYVTDAETRSTVEATAKLLSDMGHHVEEMPLPIKPSYIDDFVLYWSLLAFFVKIAGKYLIDPSFEARQLDQFSQGLTKLFKDNFYKAPLFLYRLRRSYQQYAAIFRRYDAVLTPALAHITPQIGYLNSSLEFEVLLERLKDYVGFTPLNNTAGGPALTMPMAITDHNLPVGVHLSANHGRERLLLELAFEIEAARPWCRIYETDSVDMVANM